MIRSQTVDSIEELHRLAWPLSQLDEAIRLVGQQLGMDTAVQEKLALSLSPDLYDNQRQLDQWLDRIATSYQLEAEPIHTPYIEIERLICGSGPSLFLLPREELAIEPHFLVVLKGGQTPCLLGADSIKYKGSPNLIRMAICAQLEAPFLPQIEALTEGIGTSAKDRAKVEIALLREELYDEVVAGCWVLQSSPSVSMVTQMQQTQTLHYLWLYILYQVIQYSANIGSWGLVALATTQESINWPILMAGVLLMLTRLPFILFRVKSEKRFNLGLSTILKRRLFYGVLRLKLEEVQLQGVGQFLSWVFESENLEKAGFMGGALVMQSAIAMLAVIGILLLIGEILLGLLLLGWVLMIGLVGWWLVRRYRVLNEYYSEMTNDLLEKLQGHQTRLVQGQDWYSEDDQSLTQYLAWVRRYDVITDWATDAIPYGWMLSAFLYIAWTLMTGSATTTLTAQGINFAALLFGFMWLRATLVGFSYLVEAIGSWYLIQPIHQAAARPTSVSSEYLEEEPSGEVYWLGEGLEEDIQIDAEVEIEPSSRKGPVHALVSGDSLDPLQEDSEPFQPMILDAQQLAFRYPSSNRLILSNCDLQVYQGDRILLEGPSGGGKSTLASLLIGLNQPDSGLLLLWGLDQQTLSNETWRQRVVAAPQFHENHILYASFAFNALMGRDWPPSPQDLAETEEICRELGLGDLLDRMPLGLDQVVGEEGWRLSHGERSRLYIVRALLQKADIIILDESFASLDPENLHVALNCVLKRVTTLIVIAHP